MADRTQHQDASVTADLSGASKFRIFLSYRREDASGHAGRLFDFLRYGGEGPGFRKDQIFMDIDTMAPGVDFRRVIEQAVGSCDVFLAVIGRQWLNAVDAKGRRRLDNAQDFVRLEIEAALERDIPVVPALVQGAEMPSVEELPETFHAFVHRNAVELSDARWSYDVGRLVGWLKTVEEEKTRREHAEREQAERAERERADQERLERQRAKQVAAKRAEHEREERERLEREQAQQAEREQAEQERAEQHPAERERHDALPFPNEAARQREERQHAARERKRLRQLEDERRRYHHESKPPEGRHSRVGNDEQREPERRRISRKHVLFGAALLALAIAGIASVLVLVSETDENTRATDLFEPMVSQVGRVYFDGDAMFVTATTPGGRPVRLLANLSEPVSDVSVSARVRWVSGASDSSYGLICRYESRHNYYLFGILSGSRYNIARYRDGTLTSFTGLQKNSVIDEETNEVSARCVGDEPTRLTLLVNDRKVASVEDSEGIESGKVGIRVGSTEGRVTYAFEDFVLRSL